MKILVTGFDAFGGEDINPSIEAVKRLPYALEGIQIIKKELPTVFNESAEVLREFLKLYAPDYILCIGQAGGRADITLERVAINVDDARIPDNKGQQPIDQPIKEEGPSAYFSQLPIKAMVKDIKEDKIPASVSNTAGTFVCNHIMYQVLHLTATEFIHTKAGFMHIPFIPEQLTKHSNKPSSMALEDIIQAIIISIKTIRSYDGKDDLKAVGGKIN